LGAGGAGPRGEWVATSPGGGVLQPGVDHGMSADSKPETVRRYQLPAPDAPRRLPRRVEEGTVPLIAVEGSAYDCGREYGEIVRSRYPGYERYLRSVDAWLKLP